jgi:hypothetical protein
MRRRGACRFLNTRGEALRDAGLLRSSVILAMVLVAIGCDNGPSPTDPSEEPTLVTQTFTGTIPRNGSQIHDFTATAAGRVTATVTSISPANAPVFGFSLGTWDALNSVCTAVRTNNAALPQSVLDGNVTAPSALCIRLFDSTGTIPANEPINYTVTVQIPVAD